MFNMKKSDTPMRIILSWLLYKCTPKRLVKIKIKIFCTLLERIKTSEDITIDVNVFLVLKILGHERKEIDEDTPASSTGI